MHQNKDKLYENIKNLKTKNEFAEDIIQIQLEYDNLLDYEASALLIIDELGVKLQNITKISDLKPGLVCTLFG